MTPAVSATDLVLAYANEAILDRSSFEVPRGSLTAVIGPNGSGKSTLLNGIAGLLFPTSGTLTIHDGARIAYVLQATKVNEALPVTVRELVAMGRYPTTGTFRRLSRADREAIQAAMDAVGIADLAGEHLHELSEGQRQRVFLAQGIAQDHEILLLDEPLTGLDLTSSQAIDRVIHRSNAGGGTVVMTTHDLSEARQADFALLLANRVVAAGPPDDALTADNLASAYGPSLLHADDGGVFIDDPGHVHPPGRHVHRERSIHVEGSEAELHGR